MFSDGSRIVEPVLLLLRLPPQHLTR